jgi:hypothetical protein
MIDFFFAYEEYRKRKIFFKKKNQVKRARVIFFGAVPNQVTALWTRLTSNFACKIILITALVVIHEYKKGRNSSFSSLVSSLTFYKVNQSGLTSQLSPTRQ